ncbi:bifunctional 4-hydroxy-2-oxoglutarate aldolase/2-dehydro-3-deoxy-phosphogluconate aldolase [Microbacterium sp. CFH 31415]|uniref:bifunctional 4-hydroxy-2-oxoglutarate aldolase/2-dehydro-3-deoxy-phosphogluconate aldolase n=1 Tax=Microbacterium sp. CFH 31415 TaxID=2921732 RepID=UPI001F146FF1|nr:bifunctional 4-hydroxy-2-oxoglutarate aldolase/2-dehydro-3-deoxy-phosphogluconate aldolase [Microbacterium sp. CFH 31415]MCH6230583.1 bifunctional 4-hydroxy-2-oxoglutarate aldolase/2-dehydro-3-deoxy-phosphogluconate aldolase [Microbacterium sp. CFH 31415]
MTGTRTPRGIVPVVAVNSADEGLRLTDALLAGGIDVIEVTFRTDAAADAISAITRARPEMLVGAGTLLSTEAVDIAVDGGAAFGVAPGLRPPVVEHAVSRGWDFVPGVATASELELGLSLGLDFFKLFPAEPSGGVALIDALAAPYPSASFMPTGGIRPDNVAAYLQRPSVRACGGTWIASRSLLDDERFDEIARRAADAVNQQNLSRKETVR